MDGTDIWKFNSVSRSLEIYEAEIEKSMCYDAWDQTNAVTPKEVLLNPLCLPI